MFPIAVHGLLLIKLRCRTAFANAPNFSDATWYVDWKDSRIGGTQAFSDQNVQLNFQLE